MGCFPARNFFRFFWNTSYIIYMTYVSFYKVSPVKGFSRTIPELHFKSHCARKQKRKQAALVFIQWTFPTKLPDVLKSQCNTPLSNKLSRIYIFTGLSEKTSMYCFIFQWVFFFLVSGKGWQALWILHLYCNFEHLLHIAVGRRTKRFTLF